ncbi:hypothetical protein [Effusibacillus lacus]|uniref:Uncharacterized protein n=1 Tax=Effusibacillus lacus TaxID=1348429 RepID=A0A292YQH3_9BACL|nr:hypothetical protein [Effusibacillus lacus]TCS76828.1 hypothetical protein EDD64_10148 [Effusibacillus lacus]GAX91159.1 hypothetical protein EFBL_2825 [Effusibacillus lacus]
MQDFLARYYELDQLKKLIEAELEKMRRKLLDTFPGPTEQQYGPYQLKIYLQDRGSFDLRKVFPLLPSEELRYYISNPNNANIKELAKQGVLPAEKLEGTYVSKPVPVITVKEIGE